MLAFDIIMTTAATYARLANNIICLEKLSVLNSCGFMTFKMLIFNKVDLIDVGTDVSVF